MISSVKLLNSLHFCRPSENTCLL